MNGVQPVREITQSTLPEESGWFQPQPLASQDIAFTQELFRAQIQRELIVNRDAETTKRQPANVSQTQTLPPSAFSGMRIDRAVRRVFPPLRTAPEISLQPLQEWEGYVVEIGADKFSARLVDRTAGDSLETEYTEFPIADVSDDDKNLLIIGAVFRWVIGYQRARGGTKRRVSQITFRRMPAWSPKELKEAEKTAKAFVDAIVWD